MAKKSLISKKEKAPKKDAAQKETTSTSTAVAFDAKDLARNAALDVAEKKDQVGGFVSVDFDDDNRVATYLFEANLAGYKGWRWCITIAKVDADAQPTICDVVVLPVLMHYVHQNGFHIATEFCRAMLALATLFQAHLMTLV